MSSYENDITTLKEYIGSDINALLQSDLTSI